jgi:prophage regulatory protein
MLKAALHSTVSQIAFIREAEVRRRTSFSPSQLDNLERLGQFPKRVPIGDRAVAWVEAEVTEWQQQRIAIRDDAAAEAQARRRRRVRLAPSALPE